MATWTHTDVIPGLVRRVRAAKIRSGLRQSLKSPSDLFGVRQNRRESSGGHSDVLAHISCSGGKKHRGTKDAAGFPMTVVR